MIDPALLFLAASAGVASFQAIRYATGRRVVTAGKARPECIRCVVVEDVSCIEENPELFENSLRMILASDAVVGVLLGKKSLDKGRLIRDIENRIMTLRVVLEKEPGNKAVERRLKLLERIYETLLEGGEYLESIIVILVDACRGADVVGWVVSEIRRLGCRTSTASLDEALRTVIGLKKARLLEARKASRIIASGLSGSRVKPSGVYIGRLRNGKPFMLETRDARGSLHYLVLGPTGRGKTTLLAVLLLRADAIGVRTYGIDPKGDLVSYTSHVVRAKSIDVRDVIVGLLRLYREGFVSRDDVYQAFKTIGLYLEPRRIDYLVEECATLESVLDDVSRLKASRLNLLDVAGCTTPPRRLDESIVFNLSRLPEPLKAPAAAAILIELLHAGGNSLVVIDEAWRLGRILEEHIVRLYKEARSAGISLVAATQDPSDLPLELFNNSHGVFAFGSNDQEYVEKVAKILKLDVRERSVLRGLGVGEVLVKLHGRRAEVVEVDAEGVRLPASI